MLLIDIHMCLLFRLKFPYATHGPINKYNQFSFDLIFDSIKYLVRKACSSTYTHIQRERERENLCAHTHISPSLHRRPTSKLFMFIWHNDDRMIAKKWSDQLNILPFFEGPCFHFDSTSFKLSTNIILLMDLIMGHFGGIRNYVSNSFSDAFFS